MPVSEPDGRAVFVVIPIFKDMPVSAPLIVLEFALTMFILPLLARLLLLLLLLYVRSTLLPLQLMLFVRI